MANTRDQRSAGRDPFEPPTFTPGPLGSNDPAEPFSTSTGDTPGPAGAGGDRAQQVAGVSFTPDPSKYSLQVPKFLFQWLNPGPAASISAESKPASDPAKLQTLIAAQNDVMNDAKLMPTEIVSTDSKGNKSKSVTTHCSEATFRVAKKTGVLWDGILGTERDGNFTANDMIDGLEKAVKDGSYKAVKPDEAQDLANKGLTVFATQAKPGGHGHVATVRPAGVAGDTPSSPYAKPLLANVGASNGVKGYLADKGHYGVFPAGSKDEPVVFYAPAK